MYSLCDSIEKYLVRLIDGSPNQTITIKRGQLANEFDCAPSQINYVLSTRFNVFRGFIVESRRGGSGFVRIKRVPIDRLEPVVSYLKDSEEHLREGEIEDLVNWLEREQYITHREAQIMKAAVINVTDKLDGLLFTSPTAKNVLRSVIMREMLVQVLNWVEQDEM